MSSNTRSTSQSLPASMFQGSYVPTNRQKINEVTTESLGEIIDVLDRISTLWVEYGRPSIREALEAQEELGIDFEIGLGWANQRATFRGQFAGTIADFKEHLDQDKILHVAVAEICASEAMLTICHKFIDAISSLCQSIEEDVIRGVHMTDMSSFEFAGPLQHGIDFPLDFINNKAIPWIQSHGQNALEPPRLSSIENIRVSFWQSFKSEDDNQDHCSGPAHRLGRRPWDCPTCILDIVLTKYDISRPSQGRLTKTRSPVISSPPSHSPATYSTALNSSLPNTTSAHSISTAVQAPQTPVIGQFKPVYIQIRANGNNQLVANQASLAVADILSRSSNLPGNQKDSRLTNVGGVRYLCCHGPANNKCACYFQCRPDLAKHGRADHGVAAFPAADWAQIGPYNVDEMRILRPGHSFSLKSSRDPAHMR